MWVFEEKLPCGENLSNAINRTNVSCENLSSCGRMDFVTCMCLNLFIC